MSRIDNILSKPPSARLRLGNMWGTDIYNTAISIGASDPEAEGVMYMSDFDDFANLTVRQALRLLRESKS